MLSKKYYEMIAGTIREVREQNAEAHHFVIDEIVDGLSAEFANDNPQFRREQFERACESTD